MSNSINISSDDWRWNSSTTFDVWEKSSSYKNLMNDLYSKHMVSYQTLMNAYDSKEDQKKEKEHYDELINNGHVSKKTPLDDIEIDFKEECKRMKLEHETIGNAIGQIHTDFVWMCPPVSETISPKKIEPEIKEMDIDKILEQLYDLSSNPNNSSLLFSKETLLERYKELTGKEKPAFL